VVSGVGEGERVNVADRANYRRPALGLIDEA
jgi:hypothetical protein